MCRCIKLPAQQLLQVSLWKRWEITTDPENYSAVVKAMEEKGYEILSDDLAMVPMTTTRLTDPDQLKLMGKLLDALEDNDDVQNVWHSLENEEDLPE